MFKQSDEHADMLCGLCAKQEAQVELTILGMRVRACHTCAKDEQSNQIGGSPNVPNTTII